MLTKKNYKHNLDLQDVKESIQELRDKGIAKNSLRFYQWKQKRKLIEEIRILRELVQIKLNRT